MKTEPYLDYLSVVVQIPSIIQEEEHSYLRTDGPVLLGPAPATCTWGFLNKLQCCFGLALQCSESLLRE